MELKVSEGRDLRARLAALELQMAAHVSVLASTNRFFIPDI